MNANWQREKIGNVCNLRYGKALKQEDRKGGNVPVFGSNGIVGHHNEPLINTPTIIIGRKGSVGEVHYCEEPSWAIDTTYYADFDKSRVSGRWFTYLLRRLNLPALSKSAAIPGLNRDDVYRIEFFLPPLPDQIRIAALLWRAEMLIEKRQESLRLIDELAKGMFLEIFGDPVRNEKRWERKTIKSVAEKFSDGPFGSNLKSEHYTNSGIRIIRLQNIGKGHFIDRDKSYVSIDYYENFLKKYTCVPGDVIIGTMGDPNIRSCILPNEIKIAVNKADCILFRPNRKIIKAEYLNGLLNSPQAIRLVSKILHGQTRVRVSMGQLAEIQIPVPPLDIQTQFAVTGYRIEALKEKYEASLKELEQLYGSLSQLAFRGELDLSELEEDFKMPDSIEAKTEKRYLEDEFESSLEEGLAGLFARLGVWAKELAITKEAEERGEKVSQEVLDEIVTNGLAKREELRKYFEQYLEAYRAGITFEELYELDSHGFDNVGKYVESYYEFRDLLKGEDAFFKQEFDDEKKQIIFRLNETH